MIAGEKENTWGEEEKGEEDRLEARQKEYLKQRYEVEIDL
jgi:hypothetical protein